MNILLYIYRVSQKKLYPSDKKNHRKSLCGAKNMVITWKYTFIYCFSGQKNKNIIFAILGSLLGRFKKVLQNSIAKIEGGNLLSIFSQYVGVDSERTVFSIFDFLCVLKYPQDEDSESLKKWKIGRRILIHPTFVQRRI